MRHRNFTAGQERLQGARADEEIGTEKAFFSPSRPGRLIDLC
jgi:hypothetical protein